MMTLSGGGMMMPMNRALYPKNWDAIARAIKDAAGWQCQECGRPCRQPGESRDDLVNRLLKDDHWSGVLVETVEDDEFGLYEAPSRLRRFSLTVAHLNHQPADCRPENLRALCAPCHCRYDLRPASMAIKKRLKREREGQLTLPLPQ
jgi:5-methylcytosine-specific restriction endonuclease McrA